MAAPVDEWGKRVAERTNGKVKLTTYHSQTLGKWLDFPKLAKSGLCDMIFFGTTSPGFELLGVGELPLIFPSQRVGMDAMYEVYRKGLFSSVFEKNGFKFMFFMNNDPDQLWFSKKKVTSFRDVTGMKIRANTPADVETVKALDTTVVQISAADMYMALERGTVDGMMCPTQGVFHQRYYEIIKYALWEPLSCDLIGVAMNLKVWNSLPAEVQTVMLEVNEEIKYWHLDQYESPEVYQKMLKEKNIEIFKISQEDKQYLHSKLEPVTGRWAQKMEGKGLPAKQIIDELKRVVEQY
jgi:TRAP-type C4-dicarboxylate transport system substrate-binding protein